MYASIHFYLVQGRIQRAVTTKGRERVIFNFALVESIYNNGNIINNEQAAIKPETKNIKSRK
jgi:hypothetical protein